MPSKAKGPAAKKQKTGKDANPFELKVNRRKHAVVDPRRKKTVHNVASARDRADALRKQTLMVEYAQQGKANSFVDRRFGEDDEAMPAEDAMLMRYQKEKARRLRKSRQDFSVEEPEELTHMGMALGDERAGFAPSDSDDGSDSEGERLERQLDKQNFGGFERRSAAAGSEGGDGGEAVKSKKEVMEEIIAKSKKHKAERKQQKEEKDNLVEALDEEFKDIAGLLQTKDMPVDPDEPQKEKTAQEEQWDIDAKDYNVTKNLLVDELRARASDRLKSEEELAKEERERLERLEAARLKRMAGEDVEEEAGQPAVRPALPRPSIPFLAASSGFA